MSHTFEWRPSWLNPQDQGTVFQHNGDFSGDVTIVAESRDVEQTGRAPDGKPFTYVTIPFEAIEALVAEKVRVKLIGELETASVGRLLYGAKKR